MLALEGVNTFYGKAHILFDVGLEVRAGEVVVLLGRNGAGKSTTLKTILGIVSPRNGAVVNGTVTLKVAVGAFNLSRALFGKPSVSGYGHWHVFLDEPSMATMMAMTADKTLDVSLKGVSRGKHKLIAVLADNLHAPVPGSMSVVTIDVR